MSGININQNAILRLGAVLRWVNKSAICSRQISHIKLSNKRITRLQSDIELESSDHKSRLVNRNPRNLEHMSLERKPTGFWLEKCPLDSHYQLVVEVNGRYLDAYLKHWSGRRVVTASTSEPHLAKYFNNPGTAAASQILAQVIARRCLQSGFLHAHIDGNALDSNAQKKTVFYEVVQQCGLTLQEPPEIVPRAQDDL